MSSADTAKVCPKCKQVDRTSFSKCRHCGSKYNLKEIVQAEPRLGIMPKLIVGVLMVLGVAGTGMLYYQKQAHLADLYAHPDKLIGKSLECLDENVLVSGGESPLIGFDSELADAKVYDPKKGAGCFAGLAASALERGSPVKKYLKNGQISVARTKTKDALSVVVLGAYTSEPYHVVQVRIVNGPSAGNVSWMNTEQLDIKDN